MHLLGCMLGLFNRRGVAKGAARLGGCSHRDALVEQSLEDGEDSRIGEIAVELFPHFRRREGTVGRPQRRLHLCFELPEAASRAHMRTIATFATPE